MQEIRVYIVNLGRYTEGDLVGAWFTAPIDMEKVTEQIGLNKQHEEYAVHEYESPFEINEYTSIDEINHKWELYQELAGSVCYMDDVEAILRETDFSLEELVEKKASITFYPGFSSMSDVAYYRVREDGLLGNVSETMAKYFNYEAYGRDLGMRGDYIQTSYGIYEIPL